MEQINIKIDPSVALLVQEISTNVKGYDVYLGGGYLRDSYCELPYKDLDIFLVPNGEDKQLLPYTPKGYGQSYTKCCDEHDDMRKRGVEALIGLYDRNKAAHEVQYIIYNKPMTQVQLAEDMDMGINQIMWKPFTEKSLVTDNFIEGHKYAYIEFMHSYDEIRMHCRQKRMIEKFPCYTYDEVELDEYQKQELFEKGEYEYEGSA